MTTAPCYRRIAFLFFIVPLFLATTLPAQQNERQEVSLTIDPIRATLNAGQAQKFSAHLEGAPASTRILWIVPDREKDVSSISQDGVLLPAPWVFTMYWRLRSTTALR
jgi:hypothetical protein